MILVGITTDNGLYSLIKDGDKASDCEANNSIKVCRGCTKGPFVAVLAAPLTLGGFADIPLSALKNIY